MLIYTNKVGAKLTVFEADEEGSEVPGDLCHPRCCVTLSVLSDWHSPQLAPCFVMTGLSVRPAADHLTYLVVVSSQCLSSSSNNKSLINFACQRELILGVTANPKRCCCATGDRLEAVTSFVLRMPIKLSMHDFASLHV